MTDIEILTLIDKQIVKYVAAGMPKFRREVDALLSLKQSIEVIIEANLNHQAEKMLGIEHVTKTLMGRE